MPASNYGRQTSSVQTAEPISIVANGQRAEWKLGGVTIDWTSVTAVGSDTTYPDGVFVASGKKALRYGTPVARITSGEVTTVTESGSPTGGTFTVSVTVNGGDTKTIAAQAFNVAAATLQTALQGLSNVGSGNMTVARSGTTTNFVWTITAAGDLLDDDIVIAVDGALLTGGTPALAVATSFEGHQYGMFGPADSAATDGRQTWTGGNLFLIATTVLEEGILGATVPTPQSMHMGVIEGGPVWEARLIIATGNYPTRAQLLAALPRLRPQ